MGNFFPKPKKPSPLDLSCRIVSVGVEKITPNPRQPRKNFDSDALRALAESIRQHGILQPIAIRRICGEEHPICAKGENAISLVSETVYLPGKPSARPVYEIVAGERRFRAAQMVGLREVPCLVLACDEKESAELAIVENIQRQDLSPFEEAAAIASLLDLQPMTQEQIADKLSVSQSYIANKLRLLRLGAEERELIQSNHLTERHARALLKLEDESDRIAVLRTVIARSLNVAQTEELIRTRTQPPPADPDSQSIRRRTIRDIRLFYNTIEHAIDTICRAGLQVTRERRESGDAVEYIIRMPKEPRMR